MNQNEPVKCHLIVGLFRKQIHPQYLLGTDLIRINTTEIFLRLKKKTNVFIHFKTSTKSAIQISGFGMWLSYLPRECGYDESIPCLQEWGAGVGVPYWEAWRANIALTAIRWMLTVHHHLASSVSFSLVRTHSPRSSFCGVWWGDDKRWPRNHLIWEYNPGLATDNLEEVDKAFRITRPPSFS